MIIRAPFPAGVDEITVHGLHQWDYGQKLNIALDTEDTITFSEVHFFHQGMQEAVVRTVTFSATGTEVAIPDVCLEQTAPIIACLFAVDSATGTTVKKIILTIEPRTRPSVAADVPTAVADEYTTLIAAVNNSLNEFKEDLESGEVKADFAWTADSAAEAILCEGAEDATYAQAAEYALGEISKGTIAARLGALEAKTNLGQKVAEAGLADKAGALTSGFTQLSPAANGYYYLTVPGTDTRLYAIAFRPNSASSQNLNLAVFVPYVNNASGNNPGSAIGAVCKTGEYVEYADGALTFKTVSDAEYIPSGVWYRAL